jgi:branched-chain amino acid transport system substrate-binding protein
MKKNFMLCAAVLCAASLAISCNTKDSDTFTIGAIFPLSGGVAFYGNESRDGGLLAIEEINNAGGLLGKKIALISEDDEGNAEKTVNAFTKLTTRNKVTIIFGSSTSGPTPWDLIINVP